jgi:hypothetical protein
MEERVEQKFPFFFCIHQGMILDFVNSELALERKKIREEMLKACDITDHTQKTYQQGREDMKKDILDILVDEINIANTHNQLTMRITSAYNRINELK